MYLYSPAVAKIIYTIFHLTAENTRKSSSVTRRRGSDRKAKLNVKGKMKGVMTDSDSEDQSSDDSDPSWMPSLDDDDNVPVCRSSRARSAQLARKSSIGLEENSDEFSDKLRSKKGWFMFQPAIGIHA